MNCPTCDKKITEQRLRGVRSRAARDKRRENHKVYCNRKCYMNRGRSEKTTVCSCGQKKRSGSLLCKECHDARVSQYFLNEEVHYLAEINPGVGLRRFIQMVVSPYNNTCGVPGTMYFRVTEFLEFCGEMFGKDYIEWIDDPEKMIKICTRDLSNLTKYQLQYLHTTQQSVTPGSRGVGRRRYREAIAQGKDVSRFGKIGGKTVKVPPEFTYGDLEV